MTPGGSHGVRISVRDIGDRSRKEERKEARGDPVADPRRSPSRGFIELLGGSNSCIIIGSTINAPAGSRARGTSMGGLYVAATLQALLINRKRKSVILHTHTSCHTVCSMIQAIALTSARSEMMLSVLR
jgi:hypothetical protein